MGVIDCLVLLFPQYLANVSGPAIDSVIRAPVPSPNYHTLHHSRLELLLMLQGVAQLL